MMRRERKRLVQKILNLLLYAGVDGVKMHDYCTILRIGTLPILFYKNISQDLSQYNLFLPKKIISSYIAQTSEARKKVVKF